MQPCVYFSAGHWKYEIDVTSVKKLPVFAVFFKAVSGHFKTYAGNPWNRTRLKSTDMYDIIKSHELECFFIFVPG